MISKTINTLEGKIRATLAEMNQLVGDNMTDEQVASYDAKKAEVAKMEEQLKRAKEQHEANLRYADEVRNHDDGESKDAVKSFYRALNEYVDSNARIISKEFLGKNGGLLVPQQVLRANPLTSTTNSSLVPVTVANDLSIVTGDNFSLLQALGVKWFPGLTGTVEFPYMVQGSTTKPSEGGDASTYNAAPLNVELKPQAYSSYQDFTKQSLLSYPDSIVSGIIADMQLANERQVVADLFSSILATDSSVAFTAAGATYGDMINLTKINYNIGGAQFVVGNDLRVYLEQKPVNSAGIALAWNALNNTVGGRKATGTDALSAKRSIYGNFNYSGVGIWGQPEIIVNPFSMDINGKVRVTTLGFYKPVVLNKYAFKYNSADASCGI